MINKTTTSSIENKSQKKQNFSPKQSTINFLLSFAAAYQAHTTPAGQVCDFILN